MTNRVFKQVLLILSGVLLGLWSIQVQAKDYYVSTNGSGNGSCATSPASFASLFGSSGITENFDVDDGDSELNIFFANGTYKLPSGMAAGDMFMEFGSASETAGLSVTLQPTTPGTNGSYGVIINGAGTTGTRFLGTTAGSASSSMQVSIKGIKFEEFISTVTNAALFLPRNYTTITLDGVWVDNVQAGRFPLMDVQSYATFNIINSRITNVRATGTYWTQVAVGGKLNASNSEFNNISASERFIYISGDNNNVSFENCIIDNTDLTATLGTVFPLGVFHFTSSSAKLSLSDTKISGMTGGTANYGAIVHATAGQVQIKDCTFENNTLANINAPLIAGFGSSLNIEISGSTLTNNKIVNTGIVSQLIYIGANTSTYVYNNTFSGNTIASNRAIKVNMAITTGGIANNTFCNSGGIYKENVNVPIVNNLLIGTNATIASVGTTYTSSIQRNIFNNQFYQSGYTSGVTLDENSNSYVTSSLVANPMKPDKPQIHNLQYQNGINELLQKGGNASSIPSFSGKLQTDQIGRQRPVAISIGSVDDPTFYIPGGGFTYKYSSAAGLTPGETLKIDLSQLIAGMPVGATLEELSFDNMNPIGNGTFTQDETDPYIYYFYPATDPNNPTQLAPGIGKGGSTTFTVSYTNEDGISYTGTGMISILIVDNDQAPEGNLSNDLTSCYTDYEAVEFKARFKFLTGSTAAAAGGVTGTNSSSNKVDGFTIPLVGDLNNDGKPEVVAVGKTGDDVESPHDCFYVFDGQTGKIILKHALPAASETRYETYHGTPSVLVLLDSDRNGLGEIVIAMGATNPTSASGHYDKRLLCYEVNENTFTGPEYPANATYTTNANRLTLKWVSDKRYDYTKDNVAGTTACNFNFTYGNGKTISDTEGYYYNNARIFSSPLPQVIDFNADGTPEIYVMNKIYNAVTGEWIMNLEELGPANAYGTATDNYVDYRYDMINSYSFIGRDRTARADGAGEGGDTNVPFAYIYDMDLDGVYDIAAGGKLYYNINLNAKTFSVKKGVAGGNLGTTNLIDGHTGVADVNSDGIAEIVVMNRTGGDTDSDSPLVMSVWNPGFFMLANDGKTVIRATGTNANPQLLAQRIIPIGSSTYGNKSYIYIGDIDGLEQEVTLNTGEKVMKKFPEITVLSGTMYNGSSNTIPLHPNVAGTLASQLNGSGTTGRYLNGRSMIAFTWDGSNLSMSNSDRLKVSFVLMHEDDSCDTGFTLFDFDNDGKQDICYRDINTLRIISAEAPYYVPVNANNSDLVKFTAAVDSETAYEYPVIADANGDASADMIVTGDIGGGYTDYVFAVEGNAVMFAPAPKVWNQFMYSPMRVNEDLTVPAKVFNPLAEEYAYAKDAAHPEKKDYIYNGTIMQTPIFAVTNGIWAPVVRQPDAQLTSRITGNEMIITIRNAGTATLNGNNPIVVYQAYEGQTISSSTPRLDATKRTIGKDLFPGEQTTITISLDATQVTKDYTIRVSDASYDSGSSFSNGKWMTTYVECNWGTNVSYASGVQANYDAFVVEPYQSVTFNPMDNDSYPSSGTTSLTVDDLSGTDEGTLVAGENNEMTYTAPAPGVYENGVVEIPYSITSGSITKTSSIYIYVLENMTSLTACPGDDIAIDLKEAPEGTTFTWYDGNGESSSIVAAPSTLNNLSEERTFYVTPVVPSPYDHVIFPIHELTVNVIDTETHLKWTGALDTDFNNPANWMSVSGDTESPSEWGPSHCTDVIIPSGLINYPKLAYPVQAAHIELQDRAMLANTYNLTYDSVSIEVNFKTAAGERDRWVMYSSPLRKVYSGDFMLLNSQGKPMTEPPAVYMNFFQAKNPDDSTSVATIKAFSVPFGNIETLLPLGKSFNIWIDTDVDTNTSFKFPSQFNQYTYWAHDPGQGVGEGWYQNSGTLDRTDGDKDVSGRFIVEDATTDIDGSFSLSSPDDHASFDMIMVPNPFMAYLNVSEFLTDNSSSLLRQYQLWSGTENSFISFTEVGGNWVATDPTYSDYNANKYVAPMQSFIVTKSASAQGSVPALIYSPNDITYTNHLGGANYGLKSDATFMKQFHISASQNGYANSTALVSLSGEMSEADQNVVKLFYDNQEATPQVSIYSFSADRKPQAINVHNELDGKIIPLGLRTNMEGEIQISVAGIENSGYKVFLQDGDKTIELTENPVYTTSIVRTASGFYEINDRFFLTFEKEDDPLLGIENPGVQDITVYAHNGKVYVKSNRPMKSAELISPIGMVVDREELEAETYVLDPLSDKVYIVKIDTGKKVETRKILIK